MKPLPQPEALRQARFGWPDLLVILAVLTMLGLLAHLGSEAMGSFQPPEVSPAVSLDPRNLPEYAGRSSLRMFIALACSTLFTLLYGSLAAHNRRAETVLVPLLDILQSVPVLGFLSISVSGFIALFPGSLLGLEAASIFAIFTSQVWNMTFLLLSIAAHRSPGAHRGHHALSPLPLAALQPAGAALGRHPAALERDDELRRRLVLPGSKRGDQRPQ